MAVVPELDKFLVAAEAGDLEAIQAVDEADLPKCLRKRDPDERTALHRACAAGHRDVAEYLISKGAEVNVADEEGWSPLHSCASKGDAHLTDLLLTAKADVSEGTSSGATALHFAASKGHAEVVELLLSSGGQLNARDKRGGTPLHRAAGCCRDKVMTLLLDAKADVRIKDRAGENVMHVAINGQHLAACEILMGLDSAEALMIQENEDGATPAKLLLDLQPMQVRDTLKSIWKDKQGVS
eukprot:TRINITY_DN54556_c0_g1_i1.p1 TRINITY_DN54556_c0_g1~~TRINITY_DN54556_c0_g1_i1.p1  ORF type:complete len:240 (+),score=45.04 TRINITY_DN54556_c0_g1_i1:124-843(+)